MASPILWFLLGFLLPPIIGILAAIPFIGWFGLPSKGGALQAFIIGYVVIALILSFIGVFITLVTEGAFLEDLWDGFDSSVQVANLKRGLVVHIGIFAALIAAVMLYFILYEGFWHGLLVVTGLG